MLEWDFVRELNGFCRRFSLQQTERLKDAFLSASYVEQESRRRAELGLLEQSAPMEPNSKMAVEGLQTLREILNAQLRECYPSLPGQAIEALCNHLSSSESLANIASQMGFQPLVFRDGDGLEEPSVEMLRDSLLAVVASVANPEELSRRFVLVQLSGVDVFDVWNPSDVTSLLNSVLARQSLPAFEPRLIGEAGRNTLESVFYVAVYSDRRLLGKAAGSTPAQAIDAAARDALRRLFRVTRAARSPFERMAMRNLSASSGASELPPPSASSATAATRS